MRYVVERSILKSHDTSHKEAVQIDVASGDCGLLFGSLSQKDGCLFSCSRGNCIGKELAVVGLEFLELDCRSDSFRWPDPMAELCHTILKGMPYSQFQLSVMPDWLTVHDVQSVTSASGLAVRHCMQPTCSYGPVASC